MSAGAASRSRRSTSTDAVRWKPSATRSLSSTPGSSPRRRKPRCDSTGPPAQSMRPLSPLAGGSSTTASTARTSVGRFTTKPSAPWAPCSQRSTTERTKFGSRSCGMARSRVGAKEGGGSMAGWSPPLAGLSTRLPGGPFGLVSSPRRAAEHLRSEGARATVALAGGRSGRGVMVALAARGDLPWERVEWFWGDERCVPADDGRSNLRLARDSLLVPRGVAAGRIHPPPVALGEPARIAAAYAATLAAEAPVFDLVLLGLGARGSVASLVPGAAALRASAPVAAVAAEEVAEEPRVARITVTPPVPAAARHVIVTAVGGEKAAAVAAAVADGADPAGVPAALVRPSERVTWIVDRAAASVLLREARPSQ